MIKFMPVYGFMLLSVYLVIILQVLVSKKGSISRLVLEISILQKYLLLAVFKILNQEGMWLQEPKVSFTIYFNFFSTMIF